MNSETADVALIEVWRGEVCESLHRGHVAVCGPDGQILQAWGDPDTVFLPRSAAKMMQALPLVESGAAEDLGLTDAHLALACASHQGAPEHSRLAEDWLGRMGASEECLICGAHAPFDRDTNLEMIRAHAPLRRIHNACSGKHAGFLTAARHMGASDAYAETNHPVQDACRAAQEELTGVASTGQGIDGCGAPNFTTTVAGMARAMSRFATAEAGGGVRAAAMARLRDAMRAHPSLVAGQGRACTELMQACEGRAAIKFGADGVFAVIVPGRGLGAALKITDGATRAANAAVATLLVHLGVLEADHPVARRFAFGPIRNYAGEVVGQYAAAPGFRP